MCASLPKFSLKALEKWSDAISKEMNKDSDWKAFALAQAAACPLIYTISFIPTHPEVDQILYARRKEAAHVFAEPFQLNQKLDIFNPLNAFEISLISDQESIHQTTKGIEATIINSVKGILGCLLKDPHSSGVALTFFSGKKEIHCQRLWKKTHSY